jgi:hypothetical protein
MDNGQMTHFYCNSLAEDFSPEQCYENKLIG